MNHSDILKDGFLTLPLPATLGGMNLFLPLGPAAVEELGPAPAVEELGPAPAVEVAVLVVLAFFVALVAGGAEAGAEGALLGALGAEAGAEGALLDTLGALGAGGAGAAV